MEINKELIEKYNLSEDAVKDLTDTYQAKILEEKGMFASKANEDAEGILTGAIKSIQDEYGITVERKQGEKVRDWAGRALPDVFKAKLKDKETELDSLKSQYEKKVSEASKEDVTSIKAQYQAEKDDLLKKYAGFDEIKTKSEKADEYEKELTSLRKNVAYNKVKPSFPETVNKYEVDAKWGDFVKRLESVYDLGFAEDGEPLYISKENPHDKGNLKDLVAKDTQIQELVKGRQQQGLGGKQGTKQLEGIPFKIEEGKPITDQVREYLTIEKKLPFTSKEYSDEFRKLVKEIKQKTALNN